MNLVTIILDAAVLKDCRTLGRSERWGVVFTLSDWLASEYILN